MEYKIFKEKRGVEPLRGLSQQLAIAHTYRCITLPKFKLALIIEHPPGPAPLRVGREKGENPQAIKVLGPHPIYLIILFVKSFRILQTEGGQRRMGRG